MTSELWLDHIKRSQDAHSSFLKWIADEREKIRLAYKAATSWESILRLQGEEERLDKILRLCTMQEKEARSLAAYERKLGRT